MRCRQRRIMNRKIKEWQPPQTGLLRRRHGHILLQERIDSIDMHRRTRIDERRIEPARRRVFVVMADRGMSADRVMRLEVTVSDVEMMTVVRLCDVEMLRRQEPQAQHTEN